MKRSVFLTYAQMTGAMIIVGSTVVAGKVISDGFPLFLASTLRFALASALLLPLVLRTEKPFPRIMKRDLLRIVLLSFFGNFLYSIFLLYGLKRTSATESGIILGTAPVVTAALSYMFLHERLGQKKIVGLLLVILGVFIINLSGSAPSDTMHSVMGDLLIGGSVIGEALWTLFGKTVSLKISPLVLAALTTFCGFLFFLPFGIVQAIGFPFQWLPASGWLVVAYYGSVGTVGAYLLWYQGMSKVPASTAGIFVGMVPVSAVILSYVLLKEPFQWTQVLGILCVLAALVCITADIRFHKPRSNESSVSTLLNVGRPFPFFIIMRDERFLKRSCNGGKMSIFQYHPDILTRYPQIVGGAILAQNVTNGPTPARLQALYHAEQQQVLQRIGNAPLSQIESLAAWRRAFRGFGVDPTQYRSASEALLRRLTKKGNIPSINLLVDLGNLVSIRYGLPVAVIERRGLQGAVTVHFANGLERYSELGASEENHPQPGEVVFSDETRLVIARRWCWRQSESSAAIAQTRECLITIEAHHATGRQDIEAALHDLLALLKEYAGGTATSAVLDAHHPALIYSLPE